MAVIAISQRFHVLFFGVIALFCVTAFLFTLVIGSLRFSQISIDLTGNSYFAFKLGRWISKVCLYSLFKSMSLIFSKGKGALFCIKFAGSSFGSTLVMWGSLRSR